MVQKDGTGFLISVYRKPAFTGQYMSWNSFSPKTRKIRLITIIGHGAATICSNTKLGSEREKIELIIENGYQADVLLFCINQKLANFAAKKLLDQRSAWYINNCPGLVMLHQSLKIKSIKPLHFVSML